MKLLPAISLTVLLSLAGVGHAAAENARENAATREKSGENPSGNKESRDHADGNKGGKKKKRRGLARFLRNLNDIDTDYIEPNHYNFTAMLQASNLLNFYELYGKGKDGNGQRISFSTKPRMKIGPYLGWHWVFLGYQFNVGRAKATNSSTQYNISLYSAAIGLDYIHNRNDGDFYIDRARGFGKETGGMVKNKRFDGLKTYTHSINAYYIFNHKRFSYPAAFSQTTQQKRSCGSLIAGAIYSHQKLSFDHARLPAQMLYDKDGNPILHDGLKFEKINYQDISLSVGYAYNWVFARNWLLSASLSPAIGYKFSKGQNIDHKEIFSSHNLNFDAIGRLGIVWNTNRMFAGFSGIIHTYTYNKSSFRMRNAIAMANIYVGVNFMPKSHYRRNYPEKFGKW